MQKQQETMALQVVVLCLWHCIARRETQGELAFDFARCKTTCISRPHGRLEA